MPASLANEESKIPKAFTCRDAQEPPTDFKGVDLLQDESILTASQLSYLNNLTMPEVPTKVNKEELQRKLTDTETTTLKSIAGKLAWIATCTSPIYAFHASVALQRHTEDPGTPLSILIATYDALQNAKKKEHAKLKYIPLNNESIHIRLYADAAFQNLRTKHSQIGFIIYLADGNNNVNLIHWHSSRAPRRPHSTEQAELMALDHAFRTVENISSTVNRIIGRSVPVVSYIDCDTLWTNLMNETVPTIPEIGYRCREAITSQRTHSMCLIPGAINPADGTTKAKPNRMLEHSILHNNLDTPPKRVFMLQESPFRHCSYIPTSSVPMPSDNHNSSTTHIT